MSHEQLQSAVGRAGEVSCKKEQTRRVSRALTLLFLTLVGIGLVGLLAMLVLWLFAAAQGVAGDTSAEPKVNDVGERRAVRTAVTARAAPRHISASLCFLLMGAGGGLVLASFLADRLWLASDAGFRWKQILGVVLGAALLLAGLSLLAWRRRVLARARDHDYRVEESGDGAPKSDHHGRGDADWAAKTVQVDARRARRVRRFALAGTLGLFAGVLAALVVVGFSGNDEISDEGERTANTETEVAARPPAQSSTSEPLLRNSVTPLGPGDSGTRVRALQRALEDLGYNPGPIDGIFALSTREALRRFQSDAGLTPDGFAGPRTIRALNAALSSGE